jgi:hypothetical protein
MRELVDLIGRHPLRSRSQLGDAVVGYMLDHTGHSGYRIRASAPLDAGVTATTTYADVYGPLCFWNMGGCQSLRGLFSPDNVRANWPIPGASTAWYALGEFSADLYWPTQNVVDAALAFASSCFDGRIGHLNMSRVTRMDRAFQNNPVFNMPLASWDVSSVYDASDMFGGALSFNQPLGAWDVRSVELAHRMFENTPSFNQPLDGWVLYRNVNATAMFRDSAFEHTMTFVVLESHCQDAEWTRGRRMKPGRVVRASSLIATGDGWYDENTVTFERGLPRRGPTAVRAMKSFTEMV